MAEQIFQNEDELLAKFKLKFNVSNDILTEFTPMEIYMGESLLTPGLQTSVVVHNYVHFLPIKNLDEFKGADIEIDVNRMILEKFGLNPSMQVKQTVYRLEKRHLFNNNTEQFILHACDQSMLDDAATLVSKQWKCTRPSSIVSEVLRSCAGVRNLDVESADPARDYMAENIHPFQVVAQQANVALAGGNDPSFIHYMTYRNLGTHHFRSLFNLTKQSPIFSKPFSYAEVGESGFNGYANPFSMMTYSFPCDFDLLSDILNGVNASGKDINTSFTFNPLTKSFNMFGSKTIGCGIGSGNPKTAQTNSGSERDQNACPDESKKYLQKRQARMALLEQDKIAFRTTLPWNPNIHAGDVISIRLQNKKDPIVPNYGTGNYLVVSIKHNIKYGGFSTTTLDCVSVTVGRGEV